MADANQVAHFTTPTAILSFPHLREPKPVAVGQPPKYSAALIFDPKNFGQKDLVRWNTLRKAALDAFIEKHGEEFVESHEEFRVDRDFNWPIIDARKKAKFDGFEPGRFYISAKADERFVPPLGQVVMKDGVPRVQRTEDLSLFYPGAIVRAKVSVWAYDNVQKGVRYNLEGLVHLTHGEKLGGGQRDIEDQFEDADFSDMTDQLANADDEIDGEELA